MDLTTQCPQCGAAFSASLDQLQLRKGFIRCPHCAHIFDGYEAVVPTPAGATPLNSPASGPDASRGAASDPASSPASSFRSAPQNRPMPDSGSVTPLPSVPSSTATSQAQAQASQISPAPSPGSSSASEAGAAGIVRMRAVAQSPPAEPPREIRVPRFTISAAEPENNETSRDPVISIGTSARQTARADARPEPVISFGKAQQGATDNSRQPVSRPVYISEEAAHRPTVYIEPRRDDEDDEPESLPDFLGDGDSRRGSIARVFWSILVLIGLVAILGQLVYVYRVSIASNMPATRPLLEQACEALNCQVPYPRRIELISIMSSSLQTVAQPAKAKADESLMTLQLTLRNNYDRPQEWPTLSLDLVEFSGTVVAKKVLAPKDYLPQQALQGPFAATSEIRISVPITVTGFKINGYQLSKFFP